MVNGKQIIAGFFLAGSVQLTAVELPLEKIQLPAGFSITIFAEGLEDARQMAMGDEGVLFVGSRKIGNVYAVIDSDGDYQADVSYVIDSGLSMPSGLAFREGALYVGAVNRILRYENIEQRLDDPPQPVVVSDAFPSDTHHGWKYLGFGPDGMLYVPVGAPCNICDESGYASIKRMRVDGTGIEDYALGVRNSVGFTWHPDSEELWFTDNGRDLMGDEIPSCELNHAPRPGMHFGYPYCHQGDLPDPEFGQGKVCQDYVAPVVKLGPHVAPLGLKFYTGNQFPADYHKQLFITEHGSWNRTQKIGYRIKLVRFDADGKFASQEVFASGWLQDQDSWGRPNDILMLDDGSMLVSDDKAAVIYRISYQDPAAQIPSS